MCECLSYDDGSEYLCVCCADIVRQERKWLAECQEFIRIILDNKCKLEWYKAQMYDEWKDHAAKLERKWNPEGELF